MRQGTRTRRKGPGSGWVGLAAIAGLASLIMLDMARDGLAWQAGPLAISMDLEPGRGLAISFERPRPPARHGFAQWPAAPALAGEEALYSSTVYDPVGEIRRSSPLTVSSSNFSRNLK